MNMQARFDLETAEDVLAPQIKKIASYKAVGELRKMRGRRPPDPIVRNSHVKERSSSEEDMTRRSRGRIGPRLGRDYTLEKQEGAGSAGCWPHPRALRAKRMHFCARKKPQGSRNNRHSLRNGLTAYNALSPECRA